MQCFPCNVVSESFLRTAGIRACTIVSLLFEYSLDDDAAGASVSDQGGGKLQDLILGAGKAFQNLAADFRSQVFLSA